MLVSEIMTHDVVACAATESLDAAARIMWERDCGVVPVVSGNKLVGIVTDRDIAMAAWSKGKAPQEIPLAAVMTTSVVSCSPHASLHDVEALMKAKQVRRVPVVEGERLVGIVSLGDIACAAEKGRRRQADRDAGDEVAMTLAAIATPRTATGLSARPDGKQAKRPSAGAPN